MYSHPIPAACRHSSRLLLVALGLLLGALAPGFAAEAKMSFKVPAGRAEDTLRAYATQAGVELVYTLAQVEGRQTRAVSGNLGPREALDLMLGESGLTAVQDAQSGALTVRRETSGPNAPRAALPGDRPSAPAPRTDEASARAASASPGDGDLIAWLDPYLVTAAKPAAFANASIDLPRTKDDPLPFVTFDARDIEASGSENVEEFLQKRLSQNRSLTASRENSNPTFADGAEMTLDARGWGTINASSGQGINSASNYNNNGADTVILIDGRRAPTRALGSATGLRQPSMNIPISMIERIEVLPTTGGAIYGAGATATVVNIITKQHVRGGEATFRYENLTRGDAPRYNAGLNYTLPLNRQTSIQVRLAYAKSFPVDERSMQWYYDRNYQRAAAAFPSFPNALLLPNATALPPGTTPNILGFTTTQVPLFGAGTPSITSVPAGYTGGQGLAPFQNRRGQLNLTVPGPADGLPLVRGNTNENRTYSVSLRRRLAEGWDASVDYQNSDSRFTAAAITSGAALSVAANVPTNPFGVPVRVLVFDPQVYRFTRPSEGSTRRDTVSATLRGTVHRDWRVIADLSFSDGDSIGRQFGTPVPQQGTITTLAAAITAGLYNPFVDPRATTMAAPGLFDVYNYTRSQQRSMIRSYQASLKLSGPLWHLPSGDLTLTSGGEFFRNDRYYTSTNSATYNSQTGLPVTADTGLSFETQKALTDRIFINDTLGTYAELSAPLVGPKQRRPLLRRLDVTVSGRGEMARQTESNLSRRTGPSGSFTGGARYDVLPGVGLRLSQSTGQRLPSFTQLVPQPAGTSGQVTGVVSDPARNNESVQVLDTMLLIGGNPDLQPERTVSSMRGLILTPKWRFGETRLSIDYVKQERVNAIAVMVIQDLLERSLTDPYWTARVQRDPATATGGLPGKITFIDATNYNARLIRVRDVDVSLDQGFKNVFGGRLILTANITKHLEFSEQVNYAKAPLQNWVGNIRSSGTFLVPTVWNGSGQVRWEGPRLGFGWSTRYYDEQLLKFNTSAATVPSAYTNLVAAMGSDRAPWMLVHDAFVEYRPEVARADRGWRRVFREARVTFGVNNVFDQRARHWVSSIGTFSGLTALNTVPGDSVYGRGYWLRLTKRL
jgi:iron complex outermembrane receptor protein